MRDREERGGTVTQVLATITQRNDQQVHVEVYQQGDKSPVLSIALYRRTRAGVVVRDEGKTLRFFPDEWRQLARGVTRALAELDRGRA